MLVLLCQNQVTAQSALILRTEHMWYSEVVTRKRGVDCYTIDQAKHIHLLRPSIYNCSGQATTSIATALRVRYHLQKGRRNSLSSAFLLSFSGMWFVLLFPSFCRFLFCFLFRSILMLSLELCRCSSDLFLSSRPRTGLATT